MIQNAKDLPLYQMSSALPDQSPAVMGFFQPMVFGIVQKQTLNGLTTEIVTEVKTFGVRQPFTSQKLMMKPEGQRQWKWFEIHCLPDLVLRPDSKIILYGVKYRVMEKRDYSEYSFVVYDVIEDYQR